MLLKVWSCMFFAYKNFKMRIKAILRIIYSIAIFSIANIFVKMIRKKSYECFEKVYLNCEIKFEFRNLYS